MPVNSVVLTEKSGGTFPLLSPPGCKVGGRISPRPPGPPPIDGRADRHHRPKLPIFAAIGPMSRVYRL